MHDQATSDLPAGTGEPRRIRVARSVGLYLGGTVLAALVVFVILVRYTRFDHGWMAPMLIGGFGSAIGLGCALYGAYLVISGGIVGDTLNRPLLRWARRWVTTGRIITLLFVAVEFALVARLVVTDQLEDVVLGVEPGLVTGVIALIPTRIPRDR